MLVRRTALVAAGALVALGARAQDFSPAQLALFEAPHLAELRPPLRLEYAFAREEEGKATVQDRIRLDIRAAPEPGRFDVDPEFLTGPRNLPYPAARGFRGNPLLLFALDRDARELASATGGGMHWFRQRIRQAFAEAAEERATEVVLDDRRVPAREFRIAPFSGETRARRFQARRYAFVLAEAVPGAIHTIRSDTPAGDGFGALGESIVFRAAAPLEGVR